MGALGPAPQGWQAEEGGSTEMWGQDQVPCLPSDDVSLFKQEAQAGSRFILPGSQAVKKPFVSKLCDIQPLK